MSCLGWESDPVSSRTAEADKAIRLAWKKEYELVQEGKGTRNWSKAQQQDILDRGKAYDEDGKAFEGHHMKSAEAYPEYQGNAENIQFLSRAEHTQAHGEWKKPTNGYYDYITGITHDFGEDGIVPCEIIELSNPVAVIEANNVDREGESIEQAEEQNSGVNPLNIKSQQTHDESLDVPKCTGNPPKNQVARGTIIESIKNATNAIKVFSNKHPSLITVVEASAAVAAAVIVGKTIDTKNKTKVLESTGHGLLNNRALMTVAETAVDTVSKFDFKKSESALKQLGYTVAKNKGLSDVGRQNILQEAIANGVMSKDAICAFLENNINLHKNQNTFREAVEKWITDLSYMRDTL